MYGKNGEVYIDAISSWWASIHGHCHPKIVEAIQFQASQLDHAILAGHIHDPVIQLSEKLSGLTLRNYAKMYYSDNGSCGVEIAIKICIQYFRNRGEFHKKNVLRLQNSYHGDTIGAMSVSEKSLFTEAFEPLLFSSEVLPGSTFPIWDGKSDEFNANNIVTMNQYLRENADEIACLIVEPIIQGAGGMYFYNPGYLSEIKKICAQENILFVFDEVFTGCGRTGTFTAGEHADTIPDLLVLSKGLSGGTLPIAVTLVQEFVYKEFLSADQHKAFYHGHTMTGNPICSAAANASLSLFQSEDLLGRVEKIESFMRSGVQDLKTKYKDRVINPRVLGAICAFEVPPESGGGYGDSIGAYFRRESAKQGVLLRPLGNTVYVCPPYCISESSLEKIFSVISNLLNRI